MSYVKLRTVDGEIDDVEIEDDHIYSGEIDGEDVVTVFCAIIEGHHVPYHLTLEESGKRKLGFAEVVAARGVYKVLSAADKGRVQGALERSGVKTSLAKMKSNAIRKAINKSALSMVAQALITSVASIILSKTAKHVYVYVSEGGGPVYKGPLLTRNL